MSGEKTQPSNFGTFARLGSAAPYWPNVGYVPIPELNTWLVVYARGVSSEAPTLRLAYPIIIKRPSVVPHIYYNNIISKIVPIYLRCPLINWCMILVLAKALYL